MINSLDELVQLSLIDSLGTQGLGCDFILIETGKKFKVYHASIKYKDIVVYTDKGPIRYLVDDSGCDTELILSG